MRAKGLNIAINEAAKDFLLRKGWDAQYGARPLKRAIQRHIEDDLAEEIIKADILPGDTINITTDKPGDDATRIIFDIQHGETSRILDEAVAESEHEPETLLT